MAEIHRGQASQRPDGQDPPGVPRAPDTVRRPRLLTGVPGRTGRLDETPRVELYRSFLDRPDMFLHHLLDDAPETDG
jgi:hypothetical protein